MASYSFSSPGYVNIPPYYNTAPNGYSSLNFQYPLTERKCARLSFVSRSHQAFRLAYGMAGAVSSGASPYSAQPVRTPCSDETELRRSMVSFQSLDASSYYHQFQPSLSYPCYPSPAYPSAYNLNPSGPLSSSMKISPTYHHDAIPSSITGECSGIRPS